MIATKAHAVARPVKPITPGDASAGAPCLLSRGSSKIQGHHRERLAVVYVRQSSPQQVLAHRESAALQYALAHRAVALGWSEERVLVIDEDQGHSAAAVEDRLGFQRLLAEVGLNHVGLILGIEMSRLARSNKDWHQLLELCALFRSLLADQDGLYDPGDYNDRTPPHPRADGTGPFEQSTAWRTLRLGTHRLRPSPFRESGLGPR